MYRLQHMLTLPRKKQVCFLHRRCHQTKVVVNSLETQVAALFEGLKAGKRASLAQSITLVESHHPVKKRMSAMLLDHVLDQAKQNEYKQNYTFRIGLSGPPGAGKSTFIESLGGFLTSQNKKVAVLTIDPSSVTTGGSLLGDKTRMPELSRNPLAYIRPSPTGGNLGGVARSTQEAICLCECAGFNLVLIETVGVGQSELQVASMVDAFVLLSPPAAGDELQGMKRGVVECSDLILITKCDGDFIPAARRSHMDYLSALKFMRRKFKSWHPKVLRVSSRTNEGIDECWNTLEEFKETMLDSGEFLSQRERQREQWMWNYVKNNLVHTFKSKPEVKKKLFEVEPKVKAGTVPPGVAAEQILDCFFRGHSD